MAPFLLKKRISSVAYQLTLLLGSSIFPVFRISLLKLVVGFQPTNEPLESPPLVVDAHPLTIPECIVGYRVVTIKGHSHEQVLIEWSRL